MLSSQCTEWLFGSLAKTLHQCSVVQHTDSRICHSDVCEQPMHKSLQELKEDNMLQRSSYIPKECNHAFVLLDVLDSNPL